MRNGHGKHPPGKSSTYPRRERAFGRPQKGRIRKDTANAVFLTNTLAKRKVDVHNSSPQQRTFTSLTKTPWGGSSAGRALRSQCRGREFDPPPLHHIRSPSGKARRASPFSAFKKSRGSSNVCARRRFPACAALRPFRRAPLPRPPGLRSDRAGVFRFACSASFSVSVSVKSAIARKIPEFRPDCYPVMRKSYGGA